MREPGVAPLSAPLLARHAGHVLAIDNRRLARIATLAGAPNVATAGLSFFAHLGSKVEVGQPLLQIHAESSNALATAMEFAQAQEDLITVQEGDLA